MVRSECQRSIQYGDARIALTVSFAPIALKRVAISVLPDGQVEVLAPEGSSLEEVMQAVRKRLRWIWRRLAAGYERRVHVLPREYVSGESHLYLGRRHLLKVHAAFGARGGVKMLRGRLEVVVPEGKPEAVKTLLDAWYRQRASEVFSRRLQHCVDQARWIKKPPALRLLKMKTQWGSCSPKGELILNPLLVKAPSTCIDYVLSHELCHLREHNHSERFYRLLSGMVPDWQARKRELDDMAEAILNV